MTCVPGFKFKSLATTMNLRCQNGKWISVTKSAPLNSHCERELISFCYLKTLNWRLKISAQCNPKCLNGGTCVGTNLCQCTDKFRGPQCQHAVDKCSPKKVGFNGSYNCSGSQTEMSCSFSCPQGIGFESPPASVYKCKFAEGKFLPSPLPKCLYGENKV